MHSLRILAALACGCVCFSLADVAAAQKPNKPFFIVYPSSDPPDLDDVNWFQNDEFVKAQPGSAGVQVIMGRVGEPVLAKGYSRNSTTFAPMVDVRGDQFDPPFGNPDLPALVTHVDVGQKSMPPGLRMTDDAMIGGVPSAPFNGEISVGGWVGPADDATFRAYDSLDFNIGPGIDAECAAELGGGGGMPGGATPGGGLPPGVLPPGTIPAPGPLLPNLPPPLPVVPTTPSPGPVIGRAAARALDECDREALGLPLVTVRRTTGLKASVTYNSLPAGWALRIAGGKRRSELRAPNSGRTLVTKRAAGAPRRVTVKSVKLPDNIKFVRGFWTRPGEQPILGRVSAVRGR